MKTSQILQNKTIMQRVELCFVFHPIRSCEQKLYHFYRWEIQFFISELAHRKTQHITLSYVLITTLTLIHIPPSAHPDPTLEHLYQKKTKFMCQIISKNMEYIGITWFNPSCPGPMFFSTNCSRNASAKHPRVRYNLINLKQDKIIS